MKREKEVKLWFCVGRYLGWLQGVSGLCHKFCFTMDHVGQAVCFSISIFYAKLGKQGDFPECQRCSIIGVKKNIVQKECVPFSFLQLLKMSTRWQKNKANEILVAHLGN